MQPGLGFRMNLNEQQILKLLKQGEGLSLEFKECKNSLNRDVYETVCSFLNRQGGTLLLGVNDAGKVTGVNLDFIAQIKKDFVTAINNPQKINPACYLAIDEVQLDGKSVLHIFVPESSQVHRCNGRIFDRNQDGDLDITDHTHSVSNLYLRKKASYSENKIYPFAKLEDMRLDLIEKCRRLAGVFREDHPWLNMDDMALLKSAQLYQIDQETGKSGISLAGILLLGKDNLILSAVPHHRTDLILRKVNLDRYDDRDLVTTNLIESYERIIAFVQKYLPDPFYLEGINRISIRDAIFREVATNILIHREYLNAFPAKLIIERGQVRTENSNKPHGFGLLNPTTFTPFPKNPTIGAFFRAIGRADELGSGFHKLMKYGKIFGGSDPQLFEGDEFRIIVTVPEFGLSEGVNIESGQVNGQVSGQVNGQVELWVLEVLYACKEPRKSKEIQEITRVRHRETFQRKYLDKLLEEGLLSRTIEDKPKSRLQKYKTTDNGKALLSKHHKN